MSFVIGTFNSTTSEVPVTFTLNGITFTRNVKAVMTAGAYDAPNTLIFVEKLLSGFVYRSEFLALEATIPGGVLTPGTWVNLPAIYMLVLNGSGMVVIDTMDRSGNITTGVMTFTATGVETHQYPYFGPTIAQVRGTLSGTATAQIV